MADTTTPAATTNQSILGNLWSGVSTVAQGIYSGLGDALSGAVNIVDSFTPGSLGGVSNFFNSWGASSNSTVLPNVANTSPVSGSSLGQNGALGGTDGQPALSPEAFAASQQNQVQPAAASGTGSSAAAPAAPPVETKLDGGIDTSKGRLQPLAVSEESYAALVTPVMDRRPGSTSDFNQKREFVDSLNSAAVKAAAASESATGNSQLTTQVKGVVRENQDLMSQRDLLVASRATAATPADQLSIDQRILSLESRLEENVDSFSSMFNVNDAQQRDLWARSVAVDDGIKGFIPAKLPKGDAQPDDTLPDVYKSKASAYRSQAAEELRLGRLTEARVLFDKSDEMLALATTTRDRLEQSEVVVGFTRWKRNGTSMGLDMGTVGKWVTMLSPLAIMLLQNEHQDDVNKKNWAREDKIRAEDKAERAEIRQWNADQRAMYSGGGGGSGGSKSKPGTGTAAAVNIGGGTRSA